MSLHVEELRLLFSPTAGARDVTFGVGEGELLVLLGPSGCGKSTTLRLIAGLEEPQAGRVRIDDEDVTPLPAHRRDVAFVFQRPTFLPHRTVAENIAYPLACRDLNGLDLLRGRFKPEHLGAADSWARRLSVDSLLDRYPDKLSGGEAQRVALARSLVKASRVLLLDEPLANIDVQLRHALRSEILRIRELAREERGSALVYVTHDQEDALMLGDRVALMRDGRIVQIGTPADLYRDPADLFTAQFLRSPGLNIVPGRLEPAEGDGLRVAFLGGRATLEHREPRVRDGLNPGKELAVGFRVDAARMSGDGRFSAPVQEVRDLGHQTCLILKEAGGEEITLYTDHDTIPAGSEPAGSEVIRFDVHSDDIYVFDPETEARIL